MDEVRRGLAFGCGFFIIAAVFIVAMLPIVYVLLLMLNQYVYLAL